MGKKKDKKKEKGLLNKREVADTDLKSMVHALIHGEDFNTTVDAEYEKVRESLVDHEEYIDPERVAGVIRRRVENGESAADIAYYSHRVLTAVCTHVQIPDRSKMTRKKEMASALVKHFGGKKRQWKDVK